MHNLNHPDPEKLDRLRAGLLDDETGEKQALENHLANCPSCQSLYDSWQQLGPAAMGPQLDENSLHRSLQQASAHALSKADRHRPRGFAPYATAALLLVAVSVGIWVAQTDQQDNRLATVETTTDVPDLYEDIDFYLWLAEQNGNGIKHEETNPNNT